MENPTAALITAELSRRDEWGTLLRAGAEVWLLSRFALRLGYYDENVAGGASFRLPAGRYRVEGYGPDDETPVEEVEVAAGAEAVVEME